MCILGRKDFNSPQLHKLPHIRFIISTVSAVNLRLKELVSCVTYNGFNHFDLVPKKWIVNLERNGLLQSAPSTILQIEPVKHTHLLPKSGGNTIASV